MRRFVGWLLGSLVWLWVRTLRVRIIDRVSDAEHATDAPWVLAFWHGSRGSGDVERPCSSPGPATVSCNRG
jgi:lysophospholipid acyltransferase (LPLAT)-like uncharacterized protein